MSITITDNVDVSYLDKILLAEDGSLKVLPANDLLKVPSIHIVIWGNKNGIYCIPTEELIDWLKAEVSNQSAIEICAGVGAIGRALNIPSTDSYMQTMPHMQTLYRNLGQVPISPPSHVLKFEANEAVDHFKPEVVIGSFVTQLYQDGDEQKGIGSSVYGVDELKLFAKVKKYITIGNEAVHGTKRLRDLPFKQYKFPWIITRAVRPELNEIVVWNE